MKGLNRKAKVGYINTCGILILSEKGQKLLSRFSTAM